MHLSPTLLSWTEAIANATLSYEEGDEWGALAQLVIAAEQGSGAAASNAAWMLLRGPSGRGVGFPAERRRRLNLAVRMLERAARGSPCSTCAVELGNMMYNADVLRLSKPRNLTEVRSWTYTVPLDGNTPTHLC